MGGVGAQRLVQGEALIQLHLWEPLGQLEEGAGQLGSCSANIYTTSEETCLPPPGSRGSRGDIRPGREVLSRPAHPPPSSLRVLRGSENTGAGGTMGVDTRGRLLLQQGQVDAELASLGWVRM